MTGVQTCALPIYRTHDAFTAWSRQRNIRSRLPDHKAFVKTLRNVAPSMEKKRARDEGGDLGYAFINPGIELLRSDWSRFIGGDHDWNS